MLLNPALIFMKSRFLALLVFSSCAIPCLSMADTATLDFKPKAPFKLTTKSGKVYEQVRVVAAEPEALRILHSDGASRIPVSELTEAQLKENGYDTAQVAKAPAPATATAQPARLSDESDAAYFKNLHNTVLGAIDGQPFEFAVLNSLLIKAISRYQAIGHLSWVSTLEADRANLLRTEDLRQSQRTAAANALAQANAAQVPSKPRSLVITGLSQYGANPLSRDYYYNNSSPYYYYYRSACYRPLRNPNSAYLGNSSNGTGAGGYVPSGLSGGLDSHGGYTPPSMR